MSACDRRCYCTDRINKLLFLILDSDKSVITRLTGRGMVDMLRLTPAQWRARRDIRDMLLLFGQNDTRDLFTRKGL